MVNRLPENMIIKCQLCEQTSTLTEWDESTYRHCTSRELRRSYTSVVLPKAYKAQSDTYYICPKCGKMLRGCNLILVTEDESLKKLGRVPIPKYTNY